MPQGAQLNRRVWRDRLVASDPGLVRFRMALSGVLAMGSVIGIEYLYARQTGASPKNTLIAMLLGAVLAMMGSMALSGGAREKATTALFFPLAMGSGMVLGAAVAPHHTLLLVVFVLVMFVAVYIRRFGLNFFAYGFMGWMGYFFASFLGASFAALPTLLTFVAIGSAWILLLTTTVLRNRADRILEHTLAAFGARARSVALAAAELLAGADPVRWQRQLHRRQARLTEAALLIDGQLGDATALPGGWSAAALRRWLVDAQLAIDGVALAAEALAGEPGHGELAAGGRATVRAVAARDLAGAEAAATALLEAASVRTGRDEGHPDAARHQARHLAVAALDYVQSARHWSAPRAGRQQVDARGEFEPAVTLMLGNLPSSAAVARNVPARGRRWNPLTALDLTTRQAIQVGLAGGLAILAGRELSPLRYYWAVIAAFVIFSGTATRSETVLKGANRVVGTVAGLGLAIVLAELTAGHPLAVLAVILISVFWAFYLFQISYAFMIFFFTILIAQLYSVLHEFTAGLLLLRLEETAVGAAIGIGVALLFLPVSTRDTARAARASFYAALEALLTGVADRLVQPAAPIDLDALARALDHRLQQLTLVLRPLTRPLLVGSDPVQVRHRLTLFTTCATYARGGGGAGPRRADRSGRRRGPGPAGPDPVPARRVVHHPGLSAGGPDRARAVSTAVRTRPAGRDLSGGGAGPAPAGAGCGRHQEGMSACCPGTGLRLPAPGCPSPRPRAARAHPPGRHSRRAAVSMSPCCTSTRPAAAPSGMTLSSAATRASRPW